jgi:hypothetical protein
VRRTLAPTTAASTRRESNVVVPTRGLWTLTSFAAAGRGMLTDAATPQPVPSMIV